MEEKIFFLRELGCEPVWRSHRGMLDTQMNWDMLKSTVQKCTSCVLHKQRTQAVFGDGPQSASWMFIGEGPGRDEDAEGLPFVGRAGRLLTEMLKSIDLDRKTQVYIANAVKCRPPDNRTPQLEEIKTCFNFLETQIALLAPQVIVLLGRTAAVSMLRVEDKIALGSLRQKVYWYKKIPVIVTYHPAYLLRQPREKRKAWEDLLFAQEIFLNQLSIKQSQ